MSCTSLVSHFVASFPQRDWRFTNCWYDKTGLSIDFASSGPCGRCKSLSSIMSSANDTNASEQPRGWHRSPHTEFSATSRSFTSASFLKSVAPASSGRKKSVSGLPCGVSVLEGRILCKFQFFATLYSSSRIKLDYSVWLWALHMSRKNLICSSLPWQMQSTTIFPCSVPNVALQINPESHTS